MSPSPICFKLKGTQVFVKDDDDLCTGTLKARQEQMDAYHNAHTNTYILTNEQYLSKNLHMVSDAIIDLLALTPGFS